MINDEMVYYYDLERRSNGLQMSSNWLCIHSHLLHTENWFNCNEPLSTRKGRDASRLLHIQNESCKFLYIETKQKYHPYRVPVPNTVALHWHPPSTALIDLAHQQTKSRPWVELAIWPASRELHYPEITSNRIPERKKKPWMLAEVAFLSRRVIILPSDFLLSAEGFELGRLS